MIYGVQGLSKLRYLLFSRRYMPEEVTCPSGSDEADDKWQRVDWMTKEGRATGHDDQDGRFSLARRREVWFRSTASHSQPKVLNIILKKYFTGFSNWIFQLKCFLTDDIAKILKIERALSNSIHTVIHLIYCVQFG